MKNYLTGILSGYMIPTFFIQMNEFPETTSGKVDRKNFPKPVVVTENVKSLIEPPLPVEGGEVQSGGYSGQGCYCR